ncbi:MAG: sugar-binding protein [Bacteroidales bacterium]|jgi:parallel beta-helix repeat protein
MKTKNLLFSTVIALMVLFAGSAFSATYYVATNGNDSYTTTQAQNINTPWKTINASVAKLVAGDILYVRGGTYVEAVNVGVSGTVSLPITISAYPGELPIIDGQNNLPTCGWCGLVVLNGSYIHMSGFEVKNTGSGNYQRGVGIYGQNNIISHFNVHHIIDNGILITGNYNIVEDSQVWQTCLNNVNGSSSNNWASGLSAARAPVNTIIRRNIVYNNWGEGLSVYEANGTTIEDNIVYDNWATNTYISDASNVLFQRNMVYVTPGNICGQSATLTLADEQASKPRSTNNIVINNLFVNTSVDAFSWTIVSGSGLTNVLIANNTLVNCRLSTGVGGNPVIVNTNSQIRNNIFTTSGNIPSASGITWSNNLWQGARPANAVGTGDVLGDPLLAKTGTISPGLLTADYFKLSSASSPAINKAIVLTEVTDDYFKTARGTSPDIGAHEFTTGATNPSFCSSVLAPVIDGIAENTWAQVESDTLKNIMWGTVSSSADISATYKAVWDNTALYLLVNVKDDAFRNDSGTNTWDDDALEIFIDGNNDKTTGDYDANDHQYIIRWNDATAYEYHNATTTLNPVGFTFSQGANTGGYLMELKITWIAIGVTPASGKLIGFDMLADDDDDGGAADASMSWFMQPTSSHETSSFGTIELSGTSCVETPTGIINEEMNNATMIYPNPFNTFFTLKISDATILKNAEMKIYDVCGKEVKSVSISSNETTINRGELQNGIYFYSVINNNEKITNGKIVVQ